MEGITSHEQASKCFLTLSNGESKLGSVEIQLNDTYPKKAQHFRDLVSSHVNGSTFRGASFTSVANQKRGGERVSCVYYLTGSGEQSYSVLYPVENHSPDRIPCEGDVLGYPCQQAGFVIVTISGGFPTTYPLIGRVTEGLDTVKEIASKGAAYACKVSLADCGLVTK